MSESYQITTPQYSIVIEVKDGVISKVPPIAHSWRYRYLSQYIRFIKTNFNEKAAIKLITSTGKKDEQGG